VQAVMVHYQRRASQRRLRRHQSGEQQYPGADFGGRTPISEHSLLGCRNTPIGYGQEMRDQAALIRESVKWDFELRLADQIGEHVDRAWAIASSLPKGPVYLSLPREPLCETFAVDEAALQAGPSQQPVRYAPVREDIARSRGNRLRQTPGHLRPARRPNGGWLCAPNSLVREWAIPLVEYWGTEVTLSADNPPARRG
jgi:acetolactate synthase-1/2/3 large subunit